jgi:hypothetical protein
LSSGIDHLLTTSLTRTRRLSSKLGLDDPVILAQAIGAVGLIAIAAVVFAFRDVLLAFVARINTYPLRQLSPLQPGNRTAVQAYLFVLSTLVLAFGASVFRIGRLRARQGVRGGIVAFATVAALFAVTVLMLYLPYRIVWKSSFERADVAGRHCYILGERDDEWLTYCPDRPPPRNHVIKSTDPEAKRLGDFESIFTLLPETSP